MAMRVSIDKVNTAGSNNQQEHGQDTSSVFDVEDGVKRKLKETDPHRLEQRQKSIDKGKNTRGYQNYRRQVPKCKRPLGTAEDEWKFPRTPDRHEVCSKKAWEGKVRAWRLRLHQWDPKAEDWEEVVEVPTRVHRQADDTAGGQALLDLLQGKKRDRDPQSSTGSAKRQSLGSAGDFQYCLLTKPPANNTPLKQLQEGGDDVCAEGANGAAGKPKSIYDAWDEEENVQL